MVMYNDRHSLDIYDEFHLNYYVYEIVGKWMLIGLIKNEDNQVVQQHCVADANTKEELQVWADIHGIIVEKA